MLNNVVLIGKVINKRDEVVDNGTLAVVLTLSVGSEEIPVWGRHSMAIAMSNMRTGSFVAVKASLHMAPDGLTVIVERLTYLERNEKEGGD